MKFDFFLRGGKRRWRRQCCLHTRWRQKKKIMQEWLRPLKKDERARKRRREALFHCTQKEEETPSSFVLQYFVLTSPCQICTRGKYRSPLTRSPYNDWAPFVLLLLLLLPIGIALEQSSFFHSPEFHELIQKSWRDESWFRGGGVSKKVLIWISPKHKNQSYVFLAQKIWKKKIEIRGVAFHFPP